MAEADQLVRRLTAAWEPTYDLGPSDDVHAHITVLGPFVALEDVDEGLHARLRAHFSNSEPFRYRLERVGVFPGDVVYLAPEPASSFSELTARTVAAFPKYQPYGGKYETVVPHMTVGPIWSPEMERSLVASASALVPLASLASEVRLIFSDESSFRTIGRYRLGA